MRHFLICLYTHYKVTLFCGNDHIELFMDVKWGMIPISPYNSLFFPWQHSLQVIDHDAQSSLHQKLYSERETTVDDIPFGSGSVMEQSYHSMNVVTEYPNTATLRIDKGVAHRESLSRALILFSWWFYQSYSSRSLSLTLNTCHSNTVDFIIHHKKGAFVCWELDTCIKFF